MTKFHGTSHLKAGFDIDEDSLDPNANYWKGCTKGLYKRLGLNLLSSKLTWKEKYLKLEELLKLLDTEK